MPQYKGFEDLLEYGINYQIINGTLIPRMASTFAAFFKGNNFMAAKELAIFPALSSADKQVHPDKSATEKRKRKKSSASQKLNLATAPCRQKITQHPDNSADQKKR